MKVLNTYLVLDDFNRPQTLFQCEGDVWYLSSNGAFGQRDYAIYRLDSSDAKKLLKHIKSTS